MKIKTLANLPPGVFSEGVVPGLLGIRGELVVHPKENTSMRARVWEWSGARWEHSHETMSGLRFQLHAGVGFDLCLALRRVLLRPPFGLRLTSGPPSSITLDSLMPWWGVQLEFDGGATAAVLASLGRSVPSINLSQFQYEARRLVLSNRPTPMRYVEGTILAFSLRRDHAAIRPFRWNGKGWVEVEPMDLPRERGMPPSTIKFQGGDHTVTLSTRLKGFEVQERRGLGGAWSFMPINQDGRLLNSFPGAQLVRYNPEGPLERTLLVYWVNALGGWETSVLEWTEWLGRGGEEGEMWNALWRSEAEAPFSPTRHGVRLEAGMETVVRGRIFAPEAAERVWLGELLASPLVYVGSGGESLAPARVAHGEQSMGGEGIWVEVELSVGVVNGHAPYLYPYPESLNGLPS